jgi:uncharacterized protein YcbK (DUF882 family)
MSSLWTRRQIVQTVIASGLGVSLGRPAMAQEAAQVEDAKPAEFHLELHNTHTNETASAVLVRGAQLDANTLAIFRNVLRDHRNGESHEMDPRLYDQLHALALAAHCDARYEIISGYRSAESNDKMSSRPGSGVAKKSLHMQGRALDVRLKGCPCSDLRDLALAAKQGGVGYYQRSDFVHIDTGAFRTWVG